MADDSQAFVDIADTYNLPWTLLPAIACKESGCGRAIPPGSFNAFGWAVYTGQSSGATFGSWAAAIERVGRGLREDYFNRGLDTVPEIETRYTPPSATTHGGWRTHVTMFMNEIEGWPID
ncbi:glucosaminidase domain-containing protein [candidate division WWE3 bacterium]|nr:glucosaminidase domain-containing protein [candidate division WWE3 bacterium]